MYLALNVFGLTMRNLVPEIVISCHIQHLFFRFEVLFTKNSTLQVSVDDSKVSVVRLREVSVIKSLVTEKRQGPTPGVHLKEVSVL